MQSFVSVSTKAAAPVTAPLMGGRVAVGGGARWAASRRRLGGNGLQRRALFTCAFCSDRFCASCKLACGLRAKPSARPRAARAPKAAVHHSNSGTQVRTMPMQRGAGQRCTASCAAAGTVEAAAGAAAPCTILHVHKERNDSAQSTRGSCPAVAAAGCTAACPAWCSLCLGCCRLVGSCC